MIKVSNEIVIELCLEDGTDITLSLTKEEAEELYNQLGEALGKSGGINYRDLAPPPPPAPPYCHQ